MAKLQDWLDEFVKNNYPANDVTEWPEQYGTGGDTPEVPVDEYFTKTKINVDALISHLQANGYSTEPINPITEDDRAKQEYGYKACTQAGIAFSRIIPEGGSANTACGISFSWTLNKLYIHYFGRDYNINVDNATQASGTSTYTIKYNLIELLTVYKEDIENITLEPNDEVFSHDYMVAEFAYNRGRYSNGSWMTYFINSTYKECNVSKLKGLFTHLS